MGPSLPRLESRTDSKVKHVKCFTVYGISVTFVLKNNERKKNRFHLVATRLMSNT